MAKKWYLSKTLWFNVLAFVVLVAAGFGFGEFQPAPEVAVIAAAVIAIINLVLRLVSGAKLTL